MNETLSVIPEWGQHRSGFSIGDSGPGTESTSGASDVIARLCTLIGPALKTYNERAGDPARFGGALFGPQLAQPDTLHLSEGTRGAAGLLHIFIKIGDQEGCLRVIDWPESQKEIARAGLDEAAAQPEYAFASARLTPSAVAGGH